MFRSSAIKRVNYNFASSSLSLFVKLNCYLIALHLLAILIIIIWQCWQRVVLLFNYIRVECFLKAIFFAICSCLTINVLNAFLKLYFLQYTLVIIAYMLDAFLKIYSLQYALVCLHIECFSRVVFYIIFFCLFTYRTLF